MDNNIELLILKIIKFNGDVMPLVKLGYEYSQIAELIQEKIKNNQAIRHNGDLILTEIGNAKIEELIKKTGKKNADKWIEPELHSKISKMSVNDIYLPSQDDLSF